MRDRYFVGLRNTPRRPWGKIFGLEIADLCCTMAIARLKPLNFLVGMCASAWIGGESRRWLPPSPMGTQLTLASQEFAINSRIHVGWI